MKPNVYIVTKHSKYTIKLYENRMNLESNIETKSEENHENSNKNLVKEIVTQSFEFFII